MTPAGGQENQETGRGEILRATIFHTPRNPFRIEGALASHADGALIIREGRIVACGDYAALSASYPQASVTDWRGGVLLPGLVDTHVHFPQLRILGSLGRQLLDWLEHCALPEESRMADFDYARETARLFIAALASHGTTTALVFGSHFAPATAALFEAAQATGLRIASGLVLSDRALRPDLQQTPDFAYRESNKLIERFHEKGRLLYAVTPRFALSASEPMLEVCQALIRENPGLRFQTHLNENPDEISQVARMFPWASDYLAVYERYSLGGPRSVMAHDVHPTPAELERLAANGTFIAHCPSSNAALGSGRFPMRAHFEAGVRFALGTDVGAGTGFSIFKEGLEAYLTQRLARGGMLLTAAQLLYLATRAGAEAMGLDRETGDFEPGKAADFVHLRPIPESPLAAVMERGPDLEHVLAALFTLADQQSIEEVRVSGSTVYKKQR